MLILSDFCVILAAAALLAAAMHDLAVRTVPNALTLMVAAGALGLAAAQDRLWPSLGAAAAFMLLPAFLWLRGYFGGADAKLLAASGLLVAPAHILPMLLAVVLAGGLLCFPYLPGRRLFGRPAAGRPSAMLARLLRCERWRLRRRGPLPYAMAIAAGTFFVLLHGA